ncbi:MAG: response regulator [Calothrix sp. SM1_5_4]|nr:response regulator [Calothrix sp. SM1_5_4]
MSPGKRVWGYAVKIDGDVPDRVVGDPMRLRQVLLNVFGNAVKFTRQGEISVHIFMEKSGRGNVHFTVSDTGIGIPADQREVIFDRFRQLDESNTRHFGGTGLGLSICKELVRTMGGRIWVDSVVGKGSDFHFTVRLEKAKEVVPVPTLPKSESSTGCRMKVLMAEDDPISAKAQSMILRSLNCEVTQAANGLDAVELARRNSYHLIFMDMHMPGLDGIEAARRIRADRTCLSTHAPIVALTANAYGEDRDACLEAGMNLFVSKPIEVDRLAEVVNRYRPETNLKAT